MAARVGRKRCNSWPS